MRYMRMVISILLVMALIVPVQIVRGENIAIEKVKLVPGFVKEVKDVEWLGINVSGPIWIYYGVGNETYGTMSYGLAYWNDMGKVNYSEKKEKFWEGKEDGYYVGNIRVTGEEILNGDKRGSEWIVSTGGRIYWYDGAMHEKDISGKVAVGNCFYVAYIEEGKLIVENLTSGKIKDFGEALRYAIATDGSGFLHIVWWDGNEIRYWNNVPGVWEIIGELKEEGVNVEELSEEIRSEKWEKALNTSWNLMYELNGNGYYLMRYIWMYIWFEVEDPSLDDRGTYHVKVVIKKVRCPHSSYDYVDARSIINVIYTLEAYKVPSSYSNKDLYVYYTLTRNSGSGSIMMSVNGHKVGGLDYGNHYVRINHGYLYTSKENTIVIKSNYTNSGAASHRPGTVVKTLYNVSIKIRDAKVSGISLFGDPDNDGLETFKEWSIGTNPNKWDTDGDGMPDGWEYKYGLNPKTSSDKYKDKDGDELNNIREYNYGTNPKNPDTDGDGMPDGWEHKYRLNPLMKDGSEDPDKDGLTNLQEYKHHTNPKNPDTDGDGMPDGWEVEYGLNPKSGSDRNSDPDNDNLSNYEEYQGWNAWWYDSSGNYHSKHVYSNPLSPDTDGDGLSDYEEYKMKLNPASKDTDGDGLNDGNEYYTKVYRYPKRMYVDGEGFTIYMKWREEPYSVGVKDAKLLIGIRGKDSSKIWVDVMYGSTYLKDISTTSVEYESVSLLDYVGKSDRYVKLKIGGTGWLETAKIILVEKSNPHRWDTDGDGLSDGYEVNGKSGYITSPVSKDTDGDGIRDDWEIRGWSWNYDTEKKYRNNNGFHTNPLSKDTDGDGYEDGEDANPLANLVLRMSVDKYTYSGNTKKFAGFYAKWTLGDKSKSVKYYTKHKETNNLHGYVYWFDIPDDINTQIDVKAAGFYNDWGDKKLCEDSGSFNIKNNYKYWISKGGSNPTYEFMAKFWVYPLHRINTVAVYNDTVFKSGRYSYKGKFYVLYVQSTESYGSIKKGINVILVPDALFVNSQLYKKIENKDISYLQGSDAKKAKMGAIDEKTMGVHIVGMFFFKTDKQNLKNLLSLLVKNLSDVQFAHYSAVTPEQANLPVDILEAIPLQSIQNSPTGDKPKDLWQQVTSQITNAVVSVANFVYNGLVALGNLLEKAADVVAQFAVKLWATAVNTVKEAAEVVKKVVDAMRQGLINLAKEILNTIVEPIKNAINNFVETVKGIAYAIKELITNGEGTLNLLSNIFSSKIFNTLTMLPMIIGTIYSVITASSMGIGAIVMQFLPGLVGNVIVHSLVSNINTLSITTPYASDTSGLGINILHLLLNAGGINTIDKGMGLLGFGATMIGMYISYVVYKSAMNRLKDAIILAKKINSIYGQGQVSVDTFFASINQLANGYKELGGVIGEFSNEDINNEFGNLGAKLRAVTYISLIVGGVSLVISAIPFFVNMPSDIKVMLEGLGLGLASYSLYKSIVNKITIPGLPTTLSNIGLVLNGISVGAGAYGFARELSG